MTLFVASAGKRITVRKIVTDSSSVNIESPSGKAFVYTLESASVRLLGSDVGFDFSIDDGSDNISLWGADTFGSETCLVLTNHHTPIEYGKTLKFKASGSSTLHVVVVLIESDTSGQGGQ